MKHRNSQSEEHMATGRNNQVALCQSDPQTKDGQVMNYISDWEQDKAVDRHGNTKTTVTPEDLLQKVPGFRDLLEKVQRIRERHPALAHCPVTLRSESIDGQSSVREDFESLVGWKSRNPDFWVRTSAAYNVGVRMLADALYGRAVEGLCGHMTR
jgi:hypothetical protein